MVDIAAAAQFKLEIDGVSAAIWVARFDGEEAISSLFQFHVLFISDDAAIACNDVIGKTALLTLEADQSEPRYVHGIVSRFEQGEEGKRQSSYHLTLVPKHWRLQYRHDSRIFQEMSIPDILKKVFTGAGLAAGDDFKMSLQGTYSPREYCVQYRESDWAFASRLMEQAGIHTYFEHTDGKHTLVLGDKPSAHKPITGKTTLNYRAPLGAMAHNESVSRFIYSEEVRPGKVTLRDYNFLKPSLSLEAMKQGPVDDDLEVYDYPGEYDLPGDGTDAAQVRLEEWQTVRKVGEGDSGCMRFTPGHTFTLAESSRDAYNRNWLITRVRHSGVTPTIGGGAVGDDKESYTQSFQVIPDDVPFRPARRTPSPLIPGAQTAIVVGPGGEEIYVDEHARVKVQFHWDRLGKNDDKSSCWIRVSQLWAGAGWGAMWIPRIGHEVIVEFLEGDPDRPIITGRVYHGTNVPPYGLPAEKTKSTIKSNSSQGGGGSNELRFEDKKGNEEIYLHGQKDWNIKIEHDKAQLIGNDEKLEVDHDRSKEVKHDQSEIIGNDKTIDVGKDHNESIGSNETLMIGADAERTVGGNQTETIGKSSTVNVASAYSVTVGAEMSLEVGAAMTQSVGGNSAESVGGDRSLSVTGGLSMAVSKGMKVEVAKDAEEKVDGEKKIEVAKTYTLTVGDGSVTVEKDGTITIHGKDITIKGSGQINLQASSKVVLKSDGPVEIEGGGAVKIKGSAVNMN